MTGTGTQNDPYIVDTWPDFVTAIGTSGAYVKVADDTVWDMNSIAPEGITQSLQVNANVDGNGVKIVNLHIENLSAVIINANGYLENINFTDVFAKATNGNYYFIGRSRNVKSGEVGRYISITGKFYGYGTSGSNKRIYAIFGNGSDTSFMSCSTNVELYGTAQLCKDDSNWDAYSPLLVNCNLKYVRLPISGVYAWQNHIAVKNSWVEGSEYTTVCISNSSENSIFNVSAFGNITDGNSRTCLLWNSDKIESGVSISSGIKLCSEAQLQDAAYLASIGFPIGVD